jgi:hypothetical protein
LKLLDRGEMTAEEIDASRAEPAWYYESRVLAVTQHGDGDGRGLFPGRQVKDNSCVATAAIGKVQVEAPRSSARHTGVRKDACYRLTKSLPLGPTGPPVVVRDLI